MFERIICTTDFPYIKCNNNRYNKSLPTDAWSNVLSFLPEDSYNVIKQIIPNIPKKYFNTCYENQCIFMPDYLLIAYIQDNIKIYYCISKPIMLIVTINEDNKVKLKKISKSLFKTAVHNRNCHYFGYNTKIEIRKQCKEWFFNNQQYFHYETDI